jgi:histone H3/H4
LAGGGDNEGEDAAEAGPSSGPTPPLPFGFPLSLVKKIACMDPDVDRMAGDAVKVLSKATALFVELLATKSYTLATTLKRKNFKYSDIEAVAKKDRRLGDMGLAEMFEKDAAFEEVRTKIAEEAQNKLAGGSSGRGRKKAVTTEEGGEGGGEKKKQRKEKPLTAFFGAKPAAGNENNEEEVQVAEDEEEEEEAAVPMAEELEEEQVGAEDEEEEEEEDAEAEEEADDPLEEDEDAIEEEDEEEEENDDDDAE